MNSMEESEGMGRNLPSPEGEALGIELARLASTALAARKQQFPNHKEPCRTCAFRLGTIPNRCLATLADALKCLIEQEAEFYCHEEKGCICTGYFLLAIEGGKAGKVPWEFSYEQERTR